MAKKKKKTIHQNLGEINLDGSIEGAIKDLQKKKKELEDKGYFDINIECEDYYDYGDSCARISMDANRLETDEEYDKRMERDKGRAAAAAKAAATRAKNKEAKELEIYEKLRKKFEKKKK